MHLYILGRQPALGLAELERLCGAQNVAPFGDFAATVENNPPDFSQLGGSIKQVEIVGEIPYKNPGKLNSFLLKNAEELFAPGDSGRHTLGLSLYGTEMPAKKLNALLLSIKKQLRTEERSIRIVEHKNSCALESASVIHNGLLENNGRELIVAVHKNRAVIGLTEYEQDIEHYTLRDRGRPKRDSRVGMLPPKLAQIIINLAAGPLKPESGNTILDPFCGTGVLLQEAGLMGFSTYGTDIESRMIEFSRKNAEWAAETFGIQAPRLQVGDATNVRWQPGFSAVAAEGYLGSPLNSLPESEKLDRIIGNCNTVISKFLQNLAAQTPPDFNLCLAVPAWQISPEKFRHLPLVDDLPGLGYNRVDLKNVRHGDLLYYREDQIVARELLVLTRK